MIDSLSREKETRERWWKREVINNLYNLQPQLVKMHLGMGFLLFKSNRLRETILVLNRPLLIFRKRNFFSNRMLNSWRRQEQHKLGSFDQNISLWRELRPSEGAGYLKYATLKLPLITTGSMQAANYVKWRMLCL